MAVTEQKTPRIIPEIFFNRTSESGSEEAVLHKKDGKWISVSWKEYEGRVRDLARAISDWVQPGDVVCIMGENRMEWCVTDLAVLSLGGVVAPIYPSNPPKDVAYILNDCEAKLLFVSSQHQLDKLVELKKEEKVPKLERVVVFEDVPKTADWVSTLGEVYPRNPTAVDPIPERMAAIRPEDLATLIYTSGTTGEPKGVMLSHRNIVSNVLGARAVFDNVDLSVRRMLSFLPLSHSLERTVGYYAAVAFGFTVAFAESIPKLIDNLSEVRPTMLISVPRIYEKIHAKVMGGAKSGVKGALVHWALGVGSRHAKLLDQGKSIPFFLGLQHSLASKLVFSKLHEKFGGRLKYAISGGAALAKEIGEFLTAIGLTVFEGYGLTETSPILCANIPGAARIGTVGKPWPGVEIKIAPEPGRERDGEILAKGPNIMMGYYKKPEITAETIDSDGWLHTGDIGYIDNDGFLHITDRKKDLIKTAGGKYVAPQPIESKLKLSPLIDQAIVIGEKRKYCVGLIAPNFESLEEILGSLPEDRAKLNDDPRVRALFQPIVDEVNKDLGRWEQLKKFHVLPHELSQETGELTPTLKVKRRVVDDKYKELIDAMYPKE